MLAAICLVEILQIEGANVRSELRLTVGGTIATVLQAKSHLRTGSFVEQNQRGRITRMALWATKRVAHCTISQDRRANSDSLALRIVRQGDDALGGGETQGDRNRGVGACAAVA